MIKKESKLQVIRTNENRGLGLLRLFHGFTGTIGVFYSVFTGKKFVSTVFPWWCFHRENKSLKNVSQRFQVSTVKVCTVFQRWQKGLFWRWKRGVSTVVLQWHKKGFQPCFNGGKEKGFSTVVLQWQKCCLRTFALIVTAHPYCARKFELK